MGSGVLRRRLMAIGLGVVTFSGVIVASGVLGGSPASAAGSTVITKGDLAVSVGSEVDEFTPSGTFVQPLVTSSDGLVYPTGSAFDGNGNLYVSDFSGNQILKRDALTGTVSVFASNSTIGNGQAFNAPESIVFNKGYTRMYVSGANRGGPGGGINVLDAVSGTGVGFYALPSSSGSAGSGESDWLAFDANSNLYMTNENPTQGVMKVDETTGDIVQPSRVSNLPDDGYAISFDKNGNLWIGDTSSILEFDASGATIRTISNPNFSTVFAAVFNAAGDQLYAGDLGNGMVYIYDLSGNLVSSFSAGSSVSGLSVSGAFVPPNAPTGRYVALGDSYSAGEGAIDGAGNASLDPSTASSTDQCHRSYNAYSYAVQTKQSVSDSNFIFKACSGAQMADFVAKVNNIGQWTEGSQLAELPKDTSSLATNLVTLSIGGNDAGFPLILNNCVSGTGAVGIFFHNSDKHCIDYANRSWTQGRQLLTQGGTILFHPKDGSWQTCNTFCQRNYHARDYFVVTVPSLSGLYGAIHVRAKQARIRVLLYPHLFAASPPSSCVVGQFHAIAATHSFTLSAAKMKALNTLGDSLDQTIMDQVAVAKQAGIDIETVDPRTDFQHHGVHGEPGTPACDTDTPWINGLLFSGRILRPSAVSVFSFHPNLVGQAHFATDVEAKLQ